jgi:hypothetical protein
MIPYRRRIRAFAWILLPILATAPAPAQGDAVELSVLAAPGGAYSESEGFELETAYGAGLGFGFAEAWQVEVRALTAEDELEFESFEQRSFELGLRRFFAAGTWRPFLQAGARFREAEVSRQVVCTDITTPCPALTEQREEVGPFVGGGVDLDLARWLALRADGRFNVYESDATGDVESDVDLTLGAVFRF